MAPRHAESGTPRRYAPYVVSQPQDAAPCAGEPVTFEITVANSGVVTYQWRKDGVDIAGANAHVYSIKSVTPDDEGEYVVVIARACAIGTSEPATLTVGGGACCTSDWNADGAVNSTDVSDFINAWLTDQTKGTLTTDWDHNGVVNSTDVSAYINAWFAESTGGRGG